MARFCQRKRQAGLTNEWALLHCKPQVARLHLMNGSRLSRRTASVDVRSPGLELSSWGHVARRGTAWGHGVRTPGALAPVHTDAVGSGKDHVPTCQEALDVAHVIWSRQLFAPVCRAVSRLQCARCVHVLANEALRSTLMKGKHGSMGCAGKQGARTLRWHLVKLEVSIHKPD